MIGTLVDLGPFSPPRAPGRRVRLWIPAGVDPEAPCATVYLLDGQNVFGDEGSFAGGWNTHRAAARIGLQRHWRPVIVAIDNGGLHRITELGRDGERFVDAIADDLVPRVERHVRGGGPRLIGGASLGGLAALWGWFRRPDVFTRAMAMSPSLWFERRRLLSAFERGDLTVPDGGRVYLDAGGREAPNMPRNAARLARELGLGDDRLRFVLDPLGAHRERDWGRRFPKAARFLLDRRQDQRHDR